MTLPPGFFFVFTHHVSLFQFFSPFARILSLVAPALRTTLSKRRAQGKGDTSQVEQATNTPRVRRDRGQTYSRQDSAVGSGTERH